MSARKKKARIGRPPKPRGTQRDHRVAISVTGSELRELQKLAGDEPLAIYVHRELVRRILKRCLRSS